MRTLLFSAAFVAVVSCATLREPANRILEGAETALGALCDARESRYLDLAKDFLERGDLQAAIAELKMFLVTHGYDREVAALLNLLETQLPQELPPTEVPTNG